MMDINYINFNDGLIHQTRAHTSCLSVKISTVAFEFLESHMMPFSYNARTADFGKS